MTRIGLYTVSYDGQSIVSIYRSGVSPEDFSRAVDDARGILAQFPRSKPGSDWGCDGVGYVIQQRAGVVQCRRSGVGPRKYRQALAALGVA